MNPTQENNLLTHHIDFTWSPSCPSAARGFCDGCQTYFDSPALPDSSYASALHGKAQIREAFGQYPCRKEQAK